MWKHSGNYVEIQRNDVKIMWKHRGNYVGKALDVCGNSMESLWTVRGNYVESMWKYRGNYVENRRKYLENNWNYRGNDVEKQWKLYGKQSGMALCPVLRYFNRGWAGLRGIRPHQRVKRCRQDTIDNA